MSDELKLLTTLQELVANNIEVNFQKSYVAPSSMMIELKKVAKGKVFWNRSHITKQFLDSLVESDEGIVVSQIEQGKKELERAIEKGKP